ncbi:MAG: hypothetical protein Kow0065_21530 [Methylomicrobium sp.]
MEETGFTMKDGRQWFIDGWQLFKRKPLLLISGTVLWVVLEVMLALVPVVGEIIDGLLFPFLYGGFLYGIRQVDRQQSLELKHFFQGYFDKAKIRPLLILGLLLVFFEIIEAGLIVIIGPFAALVLAAPLGILVFSALLYSVPLVMFGDIETIGAIKSSYDSCGKHISALISIYLIMLGFALLAIVTMGFGLLLIMPVTFCAFYLSYKAIYGDV